MQNILYSSYEKKKKKEKIKTYKNHDQKGGINFVPTGKSKHSLFHSQFVKIEFYTQTWVTPKCLHIQDIVQNAAE